jgi:bifunctional UDP-N-acetylglucosamine pyrophosphorylase / glucosamine-1-phosphate N-acetyltransferase
MALTAVILAAGNGTRMKSQLNKMLHRVAGRPLFHFPLLAAWRSGATRIIVVASPLNREPLEASFELLRAEFGAPLPELEIAVQAEPRGSGDAARAACEQLGDGLVLILNGDAPLVTAAELRPLVAAVETSDAALAIATCELDEPKGYGRVLRGADGQVAEVREQKDLTSDAQRSVREVNAGMYSGRADFLRAALPRITNANAQGEYYITDLVAQAAELARVVAVAGPARQLEGVNDRVQLNQLEQRLFERINDAHRLRGVTIRGDAMIDDSVTIGEDTAIGAGVVLRGRTTVGARVKIDQGVVVADCEIDDEATIKPYSVLTESRVGKGAQVGPFAHLRPRTVLDENVAVGNFVETKSTRMRRGAKAGHLSYLGDGDVGEDANIGAGTIFCNYDGFSKATTRIGKGAFIGSDSQLIAPVTVGDGAYVGTGTTVTEDVPKEALALSRVVQVNKPGYAVKLRARLKLKAESKSKAH